MQGVLLAQAITPTDPVVTKGCYQPMQKFYHGIVSELIAILGKE
jgi:hypothetical protein